MDGALRLLVTEDGADAERVDMLAGHLRRDLDQLDVDDVRPLPGGVAPPGTRAAQALGSVLAAVRSWLSRSPGPVRTVRLELEGDVLELSQASASEQQRLIDLFESRHAGRTTERT